MRIEFMIPGNPTGKARPKVVRAKSGISLTYTPDKTVAYEELTRLRFHAAADAQEWKCTESPVVMAITAWYPIPKSKSKKQQLLMSAGFILPTKKPDCDNIVKIICDALNGHAYHDDAQVVALSIKKRYTDGSGYVTVVIREEANTVA